MPIRLLAIAAALTADPALACTLCHSDTAAQVRAAVFGPGLFVDLAAALAPAPVLAVLIWLVPRGR